MRARERSLDPALVYEILMGAENQPGVFERLVGFRTATTAYKGVHMANDLAQCVFGEAPKAGGELLSRVIRYDKLGEANSDEELRAHRRLGIAYSRAFPAYLGAPLIQRLRRADRLLLNFDGGIYEPGKPMCSGLGAHHQLLGPEGFRRFRLGQYLRTILPPVAEARLRGLFESTTDPSTVALLPLLHPGPTHEAEGDRREQTALSCFDQRLGARLGALLEQPLSKPHILRLFVLAASLGIVLKVFGVGRRDGRPVLLALPVESVSNGRKPARQEAVQSLALGRTSLDAAIAAAISAHPAALELWTSPPEGVLGAVVVEDMGSLDASSAALVAKVRADGLNRAVYWPDEFAISFGKKAGVILPKRDHGGWGKHLALTPDLLEALVLMFVPAGAEPLRWSDFWHEVYEELGVVCGAEPHADFRRLQEAGVLRMDLQGIDESGNIMLDLAVRRGVARRLPDSGAEVGGELG